MIVVIEGMDRCGKDTCISYIKKSLLQQNQNSTVHVMHYSNIPDGVEEVESRSFNMYVDMFRIIRYAIDNDINLILNRSHIGESVYSPIYRGYSGQYVFDIEKQFQDCLSEMKLIVLVDSSFRCADRDDGQSLSKKSKVKMTDELFLFTEALHKSNIHSKILIDIANINKDEVKSKILKFIGE